jgi:hypothetical protein
MLTTSVRESAEHFRNNLNNNRKALTKDKNKRCDWITTALLGVMSLH